MSWIKWTVIAAFIVIGISEHANAGDYTKHLGGCNQDKACAQQQVMAFDLYTTQKWDKDLKESCRKHYLNGTNLSNHDNVGALNCFDMLQTARLEYQQKESNIKNDRVWRRYVRSSDIRSYRGRYQPME